MPNRSCLIAFLAGLTFILLLIYLVTKNKADGPVPKTFKEAFQAFKEARNWSERAFVIFICTPVFLGEGYKIFVTILGLFDLMCVIAMCGSPMSLPIFQSIRDVLHEVYKFFSKG